MFLVRLPSFIAAVCLTIYWGAVLVKLIRLARKIGKDPNAMPREPFGQLMRVLWYPAIIAMLVAAWWFVALLARAHEPAKAGEFPWLLRPFVDLGPAWLIPALLASVVVIGCTVATFICWRKMGRSWRIGIDPNEKLELVSSGPYRYVRHPIYALRILLDLCAIVMVPMPALAITAVIDILLLQIEARREERYMEATHGEVYGNYKKSVGRFLPHW